MSDAEFRQTMLDDFIVVQMVDETPDRIKLPDWNRTLRGRVIAAGPGKMLTTGERAPMACRVGDVVSFAATAGMDAVYAGAKIRTMHDEDADAILEDAA